MKPSATLSTTPFLQLEDVQVHFHQNQGLLGGEHRVVRAVDGISLQVTKGEILGLVGESGCGKSTLSRCILQLVKPTRGTISLEGRSLFALSPAELRVARLDFQMVFQDPMASLNPRMTVYSTLLEALETRGRIPNHRRPTAVQELMAKVGLDHRSMLKYPHEFSGGQRQRIAIARALAPQPKLLLADEPVSALDVSIQSQIINLLTQLSRDLGLTMIFISHDLRVVRYISDRIAVMQKGKIVEIGDAEQVMENPQADYTKTLLAAAPMVDVAAIRSRLAG
jgi:ABC-type glutathione transport system ATPase component